MLPRYHTEICPSWATCTFNNDLWSSTGTREDMERLLCFTLLSRLSPTKWMGEGGRNKQINARPYLPFFFLLTYTLLSILDRDERRVVRGKISG
jgi:hypothetical protein